MDHFNCNMTDAAWVDQLTTEEIDDEMQKLDLSLKSASIYWSDAQSGGHSLSSGSPFSDSSVWGPPGFSSPNSSSNNSSRVNGNGGRIVGAGGGHGPLTPRQENLPQDPRIGKNNRMGAVFERQQQQPPSPIQPPSRFQQQPARQHSVASAQQRLQHQNQFVPLQPMCMHQHHNGFFPNGGNNHHHHQEGEFENELPPGQPPFVNKFRLRKAHIPRRH